MIVGNPSVFALESGITEAYEQLGQRALGFFLIHLCGHTYGVRAPDSTMLACSFDSVRRRISRRGGHAAPFAEDSDAGKIADSFLQALYGDYQEAKLFFGITCLEFSHLIYSNEIVWAPDGDEAFDDSSYVLQFDVMERVRLIAFRSAEGYVHGPGTLSEVTLPIDEYYDILQAWSTEFEAEWATKVGLSHT